MNRIENIFNSIKVCRSFVDSDKGKGDLWKVTIKYNGKQYTYYFYKELGSASKGIRPDLNEILFRMISDKECIDCLGKSVRYKDFLEKHDYIDGVASREVYENCLKVKENLERVFTRREYETLRRELYNGY